MCPQPRSMQQLLSVEEICSMRVERSVEEESLHIRGVEKASSDIWTQGDLVMTLAIKPAVSLLVEKTLGSSFGGRITDPRYLEREREKKKSRKKRETKLIHHSRVFSRNNHCRVFVSPGE